MIDKTAKEEIVYSKSKFSGECGFCGIVAFSHRHPKGSLPKDFVVDDVPVEIPAEPISYEPGSMPGDTTVPLGETFYEPVKGEKILVTRWVVWPGYDFIFGVPAKDNPHHKLEAGFFQFRDTRAKTVRSGFYVDLEELNNLLVGFASIEQMSREHSPHLWKKTIPKE